MGSNSAYSASQTQQDDPSAMFRSLFHRSRQQQLMFMSGPRSSSDSPTAMQIDSAVEEGELESNDQSGISRSTEQREDSFPLGKEQVDFSEETKSKRALKEYNLDGLTCAICMEPWRSEGDHQVSCLPCGHLYGLSCIRIWLQRSVTSTKCPQCNAKCTFKDVRKLYASPVVVTDEVLHKKIESLEAEIGSLKTERADLLDIQDNLLKVQDNLHKELHKLRNKATCVMHTPYVEMGNRHLEFVDATEGEGGVNGVSGYPLNSDFCGQRLLRCNFVQKHELAIEDARLFAMDISYQNLILTRRISGMGGMHMLNKINLINPHESEDIQLSPSTKAVKDLQVSPCGRLALLASLGKKLSILSMGSNNVVIAYDLKVPAWSCSWDVNSPHYVYAGLQNGMLLVFDMRHTMNPLESLVGMMPRPIHTIYSLVHNPAFGHNAQKLLTGSSLGPCVWNTDAGERPFLVPGLENQGICTSLAFDPLSDDIVASYIPKFQTSAVPSHSLSLHPDSAIIPGFAILGSQVLMKRVAGRFYHNLGSTSAYVSDAQITKSAIINMENCVPLFAYGDKATRGLRLRELPSLNVCQNLKPHHYPILDVKYAHTQGTGVLGCLSEDKLQLFAAEVQ